MDLSDISKFKDLMTTSSAEVVPALDDMDTKDTMVRNEHLHFFILFLPDN